MHGRSALTYCNRELYFDDLPCNFLLLWLLLYPYVPLFHRAEVVRTGENSARNEKWFGIDDEQREVIEKRINSIRAYQLDPVKNDAKTVLHELQKLRSFLGEKNVGVDTHSPSAHFGS